MKLAAATLAIALACAPAYACADAPTTQSTMSVQDAQARIADLEAVNAALRRQIAALQSQVKSLQDQARTPAGAPATKATATQTFNPQAKPEIGEAESQLKTSGDVELRSETATTKLYTVGNRSGLFGVVVADGKVSRVETLSDSPFGAGSSPEVNRQLLFELGRQ